ncbi:unnamed protein product [Closterium sp. Yama58-4]|nr:unnamed protein product [Closterium sp. Yama58-4]
MLVPTAVFCNVAKASRFACCCSAPFLYILLLLRVRLIDRHYGPSSRNFWASVSPRRDEEEQQDARAVAPSPTLSLINTADPPRSTFTQAQPATVFPPSKSDYFGLHDLLTPEQQALRLRVREFMERVVAPIAPAYWEKAEFPHELVPQLATLKLAGTTIKGYGCPGLSMTAAGVAAAELARVDASCATFILVHSCLGMLTIALCGSEEQKQRDLPQLAELKKSPAGLTELDYGSDASALTTTARKGLTEPDYGSDASALTTTARKVQGGWVLNGFKRWIGNSTFADVIIIFARNTSTNQVNGFIVRKGAKGYSAVKMENKIGLRIVQNGDITLKDVFVPDCDRLPGVNSFQDTNKVLAVSRVMVSWLPVGMSMGIYDICLRYLQQRSQFSAAARLLPAVPGEAGADDRGPCQHGQGVDYSSSARSAALGRELLGGNGILAEFLVAKHFCDLEPIYTYEGTYDVNALVTGREVTGIASIKAPPARKAKDNGKGML